MRVDTELLSSIYMERLQSLRGRAEESGISKSGSVEVLRARLISNLVLSDMDLSWEGIQSMPHKEIGRSPEGLRHQVLRFPQREASAPVAPSEL